MDEVALKGDCANCAGLCCVAFAFDKSSQFAIDKQAGIACPNLSSDCRCAIHADLQQRGFGGCVTYDCNGAGQRVTQEVFDGRSWQTEPKLLRPMMNAFRTLRQAQDLLALLTEARKLPLPDKEQSLLKDFMVQLSQPKGWTQTTLADFDNGTTAKDVQTFLTTLRPYTERLLGTRH